MPIKIKGSSFTLSVVYLRDKRADIIHQALTDKIAQAPRFLRHAPIIVNVSYLMAPVHWKNLQQAITNTGLRIIGISGCKNSMLQSEIERAGLPILAEGKENFSDLEINTQIKKTILIDTPVRSGQCIYAPNCDLIVTSHVSAGAELIADGNIHIYNALRGRALAGANSDKEAQIFCTNLMAELVSIAGKYWLSDKIPSEFYGKPARLRLIDNTMIVQPLN